MKLRNHRKTEHTINIELSAEDAGQIAILIKAGIEANLPRKEFENYLSLALSLQRRVDEIRRLPYDIEADNYETI